MAPITIITIDHETGAVSMEASAEGLITEGLRSMMSAIAALTRAEHPSAIVGRDRLPCPCGGACLSPIAPAFARPTDPCRDAWPS